MVNHSVTPKGNPKGRQAQITSYYEPAAVERLKALSETTQKAQSEYLREALNDVLAKHTWRKQVPSCFGLVDVLFAVNAADTKRAKAAIAAAKAAGATFEDFAKEVVWHCYKEAPAFRASDHTERQVSRAKVLWGKLG